MGERAEDKRLQELFDKGVTPTSISRCDSINNCLYEAYITYKLNDRGKSNIWATVGSRIHDCLEEIVNGNATEKDLLPAMQAELEDAELFGIDFPKDSRGNDTIRQSWISNMTHFCNTYVKPEGNYSTEELFIYESPNGTVLRGYIDLQKHNEDGSIDIIDYKTSSMYSGEDIKKHGRQLVIYQMGLEQAGYKVNSVAWQFLKYVKITFTGKKTSRSKEETVIEKIIERRKIGEEMSKYVEYDLDKLGYDEIDIQIYLDEFKKQNDFYVLPQDVCSKYNVEQCIIEYQVTEDIKKECVEYIENTMTMWDSLGDDESLYTHRPFTKKTKTGKEVSDYFYCTSLCSHFDKCPHIHDYLDTQENESDEDLF